MTDMDRLGAYIARAIGAGIPKDALRDDLVAEGWTLRETDAALAAWSDAAGPAGAVPRPVRSTAARDALFYALLFITFGMVWGQSLALLFGQIDVWLADETTRFLDRADTARWSMAALMVFAPTFVLLDRSDRRALAADPARRHGTVRRWLGSMAILVAVIVLLSDALYLIYTFLGGALTSRFVAKSLLVAVMALIGLGYFRQDRGRLPATAGLFALALIAVGTGLAATGGPGQGRIDARNEARLMDLTTLSGVVQACVDGPEPLPETLDPMTCGPVFGSLSGMAAEVRYERLDAQRYRLCAPVDAPFTLRRNDLLLNDGEVCRELTRD